MTSQHVAPASWIPVATDVVIHLRALDWNRFDPDYREWWDTSEEESHKEMLEEWGRRKMAYLGSAARRALHRALIGEVVRQGHRGKLNENVVYDEDRTTTNGYVDYEVTSSSPAGDVRITEDTRLVIAVG